MSLHRVIQSWHTIQTCQCIAFCAAQCLCFDGTNTDYAPLTCTVERNASLPFWAVLCLLDGPFMQSHSLSDIASSFLGILLYRQNSSTPCFPSVANTQWPFIYLWWQTVVVKPKWNCCRGCLPTFSTDSAPSTEVSQRACVFSNTTIAPRHSLRRMKYRQEGNCCGWLFAAKTS